MESAFSGAFRIVRINAALLAMYSSGITMIFFLEMSYSLAKYSAVLFALFAGLDSIVSIGIFFLSSRFAISGAFFLPRSVNGLSSSLREKSSQLLFAWRTRMIVFKYVYFSAYKPLEFM